MIVALRVLLLAVAAAALTAAVAIGVRGRGDDQAAVRYACPMHPEVRAGAPGECPICRMALERVGRSPALSARATPDTADLAAVENIRRHNIVDFVRRRSLLGPERNLRGAAAVGAGGIVEMLLYDDEIAALDLDEVGTFTPTSSPTRHFAVRRDGARSEKWDGSTSQLRFRLMAIDRGTGSPRPGQVGWVELSQRPRQVLAVPASAILQSPEGPYVLAWTGAGFDFEKRPIEIGETFLKEGFAVVLSGLQVSQRVVGRATFFLEADRRAAARPIETAWNNP